MDELKRPSKLVSILFTIMAVCSLLTFTLMATGGKKSTGLVLFGLFTAGLLLFSAIANWVVYFKKYVQFEVQSKLEERTEGDRT
jgi:hypothetical protein